MKVHIPKSVLFLHAFPLSKEMFRHQFRALEEEGIPYIALDYPGFGEEPPYPGEVSVETLTDYVVSKINAFGVRKVIPVGDSMGGYIMFDLWRRYKDLVGGFVFVATRAEGETSEGKKARYNLIGRVKEEGTAFLIDTMIENQTSPKTKEDQEKIRQLRCMMEKATPEVVVKTLRALAERKDSTDLLPTISVPTLVVAGADDDKVTPPEVVRKIAEGIKGSEYVEIENSAHLPPFENPEAFNGKLLNFLRGVF